VTLFLHREYKVKVGNMIFNQTISELTQHPSGVPEFTPSPGFSRIRVTRS